MIAKAATHTPTRVVVVEDSPTQRAFLRRSLEADGDIVVVGEAATALDAVVALARFRPDVVTVDLDIPGGGQELIEQIMRSDPRPVLVLSARVATTRPSTRDAAGHAIDAGALDVVAKPLRWDDASQRQLRRRVRRLGGTSVEHRARPPRGATRRGLPSYVALAASTGGPSALNRVLRGLGGVDLPVLVVQHIGAESVSGLVGWMSRSTGWPVDLAVAGDRPRRGAVTIAPGGRHLTLDPSGRVALEPGAGRSGVAAADQLLHALARHHGPATVAAVLTGMGSDGAAGLLALRRAGGATFAQDEATSAVFGMAKAALELGAVDRVLPLDGIAPAIVRAVRGPS